ncbi:MAG: WYL domain-containing protein [marine benthic group bacterium]|nr:WYL domain-containing protein [Gemmatimonadota bacterium]
MTEGISKTQRWLDLIAFLVGRKVPVEVDRIMEAVPAYAEKYTEADEKARQTVRRMFERDKDELKKLGIPIETVDLTINYGAEAVKAYRLSNRDFYLPYLKLIAPEEADAPPQPQPPKAGQVYLSATDVGIVHDALSRVSWVPSSPLKREADSALRKLTFDLSDSYRQPDFASVLYVDRPGAGEIRSRVRTLSDALLARKRVRFTYHGIRRGEDTERDVAPYGLLFQRGQWYLIGHDSTRDALRVFRVGRMEEPRANTKAPKKPDYEIPEGFSLDEYRDRDAWELGSDDDETLDARVLFEFPTSLWADRNGYGALQEELPDGSQVRSFQVRQVNPFLRWILSLEGRARIAAPAALAAGLGSLAREVLAVYEASAAAASAGAISTGGPDA